jgi:hypothetical protein
MRQRKHELGLGLGVRRLCSAAGEIGTGRGSGKKGEGSARAETVTGAGQFRPCANDGGVERLDGKVFQFLARIEQIGQPFRLSAFSRPALVFVVRVSVSDFGRSLLGRFMGQKLAQ